MYRSKPAVPIGGKYRLIDIPISNCLHSGIKDIYVLTQFNSESLNNHINSTYRFDYFSRAFVRILAAEQTLENTDWYQGTADSVRKSLFHLNLKGDEEILILAGDHLYNMDYRELVHFHRKSGADITVSVLPVREDEVKELGILRLGKAGKITGFVEKPKTRRDLKSLRIPRGRGASYLASMGVYLFNSKVLQKVLDGSDIDFGREVIPHSIKRHKSFGYVFNGYWKDIGTIRSFYETNIELATHKPHFSFFYEGVVFSRPRFLPPARISECSIKDSLIAEGCVIDKAAGIESSIVGLRTVLGRGCRITKTVIMGADYYENPHHAGRVKLGIGDNTVIHGAIIDKNARVGRNVVIKNSRGLDNFDGPNYFIRDGIVIVPKNGLIADGARI